MQCCAIPYTNEPDLMYYIEIGGKGRIEKTSAKNPWLPSFPQNPHALFSRSIPNFCAVPTIWEPETGYQYLNHSLTKEKFLILSPLQRAETVNMK